MLAVFRRGSISGFSPFHLPTVTAAFLPRLIGIWPCFYKEKELYNEMFNRWHEGTPSQSLPSRIPSCCHWWWACCCCHCSGSFYLDNVVRHAPVLHSIFKTPGMADTGLYHFEEKSEDYIFKCLVVTIEIDDMAKFEYKIASAAEKPN